jgi:hypothetical protein
MKYEESNTQIESVYWFKLAYPKKIIFHIPNGGYRNAIEGARFKREGVLKGMIDLCIPEPNKSFHGLYVELKAKKGKLSPEQKDLIAKLMERGYCVQTCHSFDEFKETVDEYFKLE